MVINTAEGVRRIPQDYLNVARVLQLPEWTVMRRILFPAVLPAVLTGVRLSIGIAAGDCGGGNAHRRPWHWLLDLERVEQPQCGKHSHRYRHHRRGWPAAGAGLNAGGASF